MEHPPPVAASHDVVLEAVGLHWLDDGDARQDLCSHGAVRLRAGGVDFVKPEDGDWTLSQAALNLMETLEKSRRLADPNFGQLFPHCGHCLYLLEDRRLINLGCDIGVELDVLREDGCVVLDDGAGRRAVVSEASWRGAVLAFVAQVCRFHDEAEPKQPASDPEETKAWRRFWADLDALRRRHGVNVQ